MGELRFPEGLDEVAISWRVPRNEGDLKYFATKLSGEGVYWAEAQSAVHAIVSGGERFAGAHGHFSIVEGGEGDRDLISLEVNRSDVHPGLEPAHSLQSLIDLLNKAPSSTGGQQAGVVTASFFLPLGWKPRIELPFKPPAGAESLPGSPVIAGVDFAFTDPSPDRPFFRVFVSTFDADQGPAVRMMFGHSVKFDDDLVSRLVGLAEEKLTMFAVKG